MRRPGFWSAPVVIFMLLVTISSLYALERIKAKFLISLPVAGDILSSENAEMGLKYAEDWLLSDIASGSFPSLRVNSRAADLLIRIEAVSSGGGAVTRPPAFLPAGTLLQVEDLNYERGLFTDPSTRRADMPFIPRMPPLSDDFSETRYYYLRAAVPADGRSVSEREEILGITLDKATLRISARRLLYRSGLLQ